MKNIKRMAVAILAGSLLMTAGGVYAGPSHAAARPTAAVAAHGHPLARLVSVRLMRFLKVTSVSGNTISAVAANGQAISVIVGATTTYQEMGTATTLAAVQPGSFIAV